MNFLKLKTIIEDLKISKKSKTLENPTRLTNTNEKIKFSKKAEEKQKIIDEKTKTEVVFSPVIDTQDTDDNKEECTCNKKKKKKIT